MFPRNDTKPSVFCMSMTYVFINVLFGFVDSQADVTKTGNGERGMIVSVS